MCGISALFSYSGERPLLDHIRAMTDVIAHRGPDGEGYAGWAADGDRSCFGGPDTPTATFSADLPGRPTPEPPDPLVPCLAALGHRRLAILDLSPGGHQPMHTSDGEFGIVFNGEIYNHVELREELQGLGAQFRSHSDTEVILQAWKHWGVDSLSRFNGMFAFVIYEPRRKRAFAARDRFGVKPLYYWVSPAGFTAFASEIKQFTVLPGWRAVLNAQRAYDFLTVGLTDHSRETLFSGVFQLRGGEYLECDLADLANPAPWVRRWYQLAPVRAKMDFGAAVEQFRELFDDAVDLRLHADVPVGTGLSGGLDSSSIVCTVSRLLQVVGGQQQHTFSACAHDSRFDERRHIDVVTAQTGAIAHQTFPELSDFVEQMPTMLWHHDEPFGGASVFAEWDVFRLVSTTSVKVTLDGHGADEQLAGYHDFFRPRLTELFVRGQWITLLREMNAAKRRHGYSLDTSARHVAASLLREPRDLFRRMGSRGAARAPWMETAALGIDEYDLYDRLGARANTLEGHSRAQLLDISLPMQLRWCDRDSMAHGIESRAPFLDYRLVEFVLGCPSDFKLADATTKRILREAMKGTLPPSIASRQDKMGFVAPEYAWIREREPQRFVEMAEAAVDRAAGIVNRNAALRARDIIEGRAPFDLYIWRLITFAKWLDVFGVSTA